MENTERERERESEGEKRERERVAFGDEWSEYCLLSKHECCPNKRISVDCKLAGFQS